MTMAWQDKCSSWRSRLSASRQDDAFSDIEFAVISPKSDLILGNSNQLANHAMVKANRTILAMASPVMKALFYGPLAVNNGNYIPVIDEMGSVRGFKAMIDFIYDEDKYSIADLLDGKEEITESDQLGRVMELLFYGDKYQIKSLVSFCRNLLLHKIKLNRGNMFTMYNVICKYKLLAVDYQIVTAKIKAIEDAIVEIVILDQDKWPWGAENGHTEGCWKPNVYQITFKVNQDALLLFDVDKQRTEFHEACKPHKFHENEFLDESHYRSISWEPMNGCREIAEGKQVHTTKFFAEANIENTLQVEMCDGFGSFGFAEHIATESKAAHGRKFKTDDLEIEIIQVNGKPFEEAIAADERMPIRVLSFQPLGRVIV